MNVQLSEHEWLRLPHETRLRLREIFSIPKSQGVLTENNTVKSDGTTYEDLATITIEKMYQYLYDEPLKIVEDNTVLNNPDDKKPEEVLNFHHLFEQVIGRIDEEVALETPVEPEIDPQQEILNQWASLLINLKTQAVEKNMLFMLEATVHRMFPIKQTPNVKKITKSKK